MVRDPIPLPDRVSGFRSGVINGILDYLESLRPRPSATARPEWRPDGVAYNVAREMTPTWRPMALFDLYDVGTTTLKVRGTGDDKTACIAGVWTAVVGGGEELDADITLSASAYLYLLLTRTPGGGTATLEQSPTLPDGDDDAEAVVLYYVPWDTDHIDRRNIIDYRAAPHLPAMQ